MMPTAFPSRAGSAGRSPSSKAIPHELLKGGCGIKIGGWELKTHKRHLSSHDEIEDMKSAGIDFTVPEMIFGSNNLRLSHEGRDVEINFNTIDALKRCRLDAENFKDREVLQLPMAKNWESRTKSLPDSVNMKIEEYNYDWTYTTDYKGTWNVGGPQKIASEDGNFLYTAEGIYV